MLFMKEDLFSTQKSALHFRSSTLIFCRFTGPIRQVREPSSFHRNACVSKNVVKTLDFIERIDY